MIELFKQYRFEALHNGINECDNIEIKILIIIAKTGDCKAVLKAHALLERMFDKYFGGHDKYN